MTLEQLAAEMASELKGESDPMRIEAICLKYLMAAARLAYLQS